MGFTEADIEILDEKMKLLTLVALAENSPDVLYRFVLKLLNNSINIFFKARSRRNWTLTRSSARIWRWRPSSWNYCAVASTRATSAFQRRMQSRGISPRAIGWTWRIKWVDFDTFIIYTILYQLDLWQQNLEQVKENIKEVEELAAC